MLLITSLVIGWIMSTVWLLVFYYLKRIRVEELESKISKYKEKIKLKKELLNENFKT